MSTPQKFVSCLFLLFFGSQYQSKCANISYQPDLATGKRINLPYRIIVVVDTNFLISHLAFIKNLVYDHAKLHKLVLIVPWIVLQELDGLKSRRGDDIDLFPDSGTSNRSLQASLKVLAQNAITFLHNCLANNKEGIRGQKLNEKLDKTDSNDDKILDCCRYFKSETHCPVTLLSNDKNLCVKAMVHGIPTASYQSKDKGLDGIMEKIIESAPKSNHLQNGFYPCTDEDDYETNDQEYTIHCQDVEMLDFHETSVGSRMAESNEDTLLASIHAPKARLGNHEKNPALSMNSDAKNMKITTALMDDSDYMNEDDSLLVSIHAPRNAIQYGNTNLKKDFCKKASPDDYKKPGANLSSDNCKSLVHEAFTEKIPPPNILANREKSYIGPVFTNPSISDSNMAKLCNLAQMELVNTVINCLTAHLPKAIKFHFHQFLGDCWDIIIKEPEPWSLMTMLKFVERYWVSVFSDVFDQSRHVQTMCVKLRAFVDQWLRNQKGNKPRIIVQELVTFLQSAEVILQMAYQNVTSDSKIDQIVDNWWNELQNTF